MADLYTERDGRELAVQLLYEMGEAGSDFLLVESRYRDGAPQFDGLLRYLAVLRERNSPALDKGFCAILTDQLGSMERLNDVEIYEHRLDPADDDRIADHDGG